MSPYIVTRPRVNIRMPDWNGNIQWHFLDWKFLSIWKYRLQNVSHFVHASICPWFSVGRIWRFVTRSITRTLWCKIVMDSSRPTQSAEKIEDLKLEFTTRHSFKSKTYFWSMQQLKFVEISPGVSQIRVDFHCPMKPITSFTNFSFWPEKSETQRENNLLMIESLKMK